MRLLLALAALLSISCAAPVITAQQTPKSNPKCDEKVAADSSHPAWSAIGAQYNRLAEAIRKKDLDALGALITPDFHAVTRTGEVWTRERSLAYQRNGLAQVKETTHISNTILRLAVYGDKATATVLQAWYRTQMMAGKLRRVETNAVQDEQWVRTPGGWKRGKIDEVKNGLALVDGKRVNTDNPYDPEAPEYDPYDPRAKRPVAEALLPIITERGIESALQSYPTLKQSSEYYVSESQLNVLGYRLLGMKKVREAIDIFKLNAETYPQSANVYDSLGEAYMVNGEKELAIGNYERAVELNPANTNAAEMLKKLRIMNVFAASVLAQGSASQTPGADAAFEKLDAMLTYGRNRNAQDYAITAPNGVDEARYVEIGGIEQWITIRGEDRNNPVLLFLHGGPGDATNPWGYAGFRSWLKVFTIVQWDQRGAGRTLGKNGASSASTITMARMTRDGIELAEQLRKSLRKDKIILVGHSWGSILGVFMVKARPDLFWAFVGTGQVADWQRNYAVAYDALLKKAESIGEQRAVHDLKAVGPPPYSDRRGYAIQRRWSNLFEGADFFIASMLGLALTAPGYSLRDVNDWGEGQIVSSERLIPEEASLDSKTLGGEFALPVFVIQGAEDFTSPTSLARDFVKSIRAPRKGFVAIEGGGHFAVFMKSDLFLKELVERVRPLATGR